LEKEAGRCDEERRRRGALFIAPREGRTTRIWKLAAVGSGLGWCLTEAYLILAQRISDFTEHRAWIGFRWLLFEEKENEIVEKKSPNKNERNYQSNHWNMHGIFTSSVKIYSKNVLLIILRVLIREKNISTLCAQKFCEKKIFFVPYPIRLFTHSTNNIIFFLKRLCEL
jgi:hypothetical protein